MKDEIIMFHGTRADPKSIREKGLLAGGLDRIVQDPMTEKYIVNKEATLQRVLEEFWFTDKSQIPEWCYKGELNYEKDEPIHIHFELNYENVKGYADMGGEPAYCIRRHILMWLEMLKWAVVNDEDLSEGEDYSWVSKEMREYINNFAKESNGEKCYVVAVKLDLNDPRLDKRGTDAIYRVRKAIAEGKVKRTEKEFWQTSAWEIRYYGDIAPEDILGIIQVQPPRL